MWRLGYSRLIGSDERVVVYREGTALGGDAPVNYVAGKPQKRAPVVFAVRGTWQPTAGRDLLLMPEGDRGREAWTVWSYPDPLGRCLDVNDKVPRGARVFQVQSAEPWGSYVKASLIRVDVGPDLGALIAQAARAL